MGSATSKTSIVELKNLNDSIYIFHNPADHNKEIKAKFIFFHDVQWTGDEKAYVQTWMSRGSPGICWPKVWLSSRYPEAQILSACYDAGSGKDKNTGRFHMDLLAETLWQDILSLSITNCPIFLIGHGLGGIVIKAVIRAMQLKRDALNNRGSTSKDLSNIIHKLDCFLENVNGVFYYNTPFLGSKFVNSSYFPNKGPLLDTLEVLNIYSCNLNNYFNDWRNNKQCRATAIFAVRHTSVSFWYGGSPLSWVKQQCTRVDCLWTKKRIPFVEEGAARYDVDDFYTAVKCDHFSVCKPQSEEDSSFRRLIELIECGMLRRTDEPDVRIQSVDPNRKQWTEFVEDILSELPNLGGTALSLSILDLEQLMEFGDIFGKLVNGLEEAGFKKLGNDGIAEQWELGHKITKIRKEK